MLGFILIARSGEGIDQTGNNLWLSILNSIRLEASYDSFMVTWRIGWHITVLSSFLFSRFKDNPVLCAVSGKLHNIVQDSHQTVVLGALVAIAAQHRMVFNASPFQGSRILRSMLLAIPYFGNFSLLGTLSTCEESWEHHN